MFMTSIIPILRSVAMFSLLTSASAHAADMAFVGDLRQVPAHTLIGTKPLKDVLAQPHTYGLGMVHGLADELLVLDGVPYLGGYDGTSYRVKKPDGDLVAFGGFAVVEAWDSVPIPDEVVTFKQLEAFIGVTAAQRGFDAKKPVPFRLEATAEALRWFVVGGYGNLKPSPRDSFVRHVTKGGLDDVAFEAFGFHTTEHRGIYTNPNANIHAHFRVKTGSHFIGHLDDEVTLKPGATLYLPKS